MIPCRQWAVGALLLLASGLARAREIPDVRTMEELGKLARVRVVGDWQVRLGLGDPGAEAGPWMLLYCQAKYVGKDAEPAVEHKGDVCGEFLGPVFYTTSEPVTRGKMAMRSTMPAEGLYCALVTVAWPGDCDLRVLGSDGKVVARRAIKVEKPRPCPWQHFAESGRRQAAWVVRRKAFAAQPDLDGLTSLWPPSRRVARSEEGMRLPCRIPVDQAWGSLLGTPSLREVQKVGEPPQSYNLELSLKGDVFVVRACVKMLDWPDYHLLARWWVNGKAVVPERTEQLEMIQLGRLVSYAEEMRVAVGWPDSLGPVKAGDKLGLQVLYSPGMVRQIPKERGAGECLRALSLREPGAAVMPLLSNKLEFVVTEAMAAARRGEK